MHPQMRELKQLMGIYTHILINLREYLPSLILSKIERKT